MLSLKDQHRPQPDRPLPAAADINTHPLRSFQEIVPARTIPRQKRALALSAQVLDLVRILLRQSLQFGIEIRARASGVFDQIEPLDLVDDSFEEERLCRVAHPGVELSVGLVGAERRVAEVVAGRLGFFAETDHVGRGGQVPMFVRPELARGADAGLDFVDDEHDVVAFRDFAETCEEGGRGVVVAAFGLDGFDHDGCDRVVEVLYQVLGFREAAGLFGGVLRGVFGEGILEHGEWGLRPVEGRDVEFVDRFAASGGE